MVLCKFWQAGNCRKGNNCNFEHPSSVASAFGKSPFPAFSSSRGSRQASENTFQVSKEGIKTDLGTERPTWILSSYGPGRDAPEQLFGGPDREKSFEEARVFYELEKSQGRQQNAEQVLNAAYQASSNQIQTILNNVDQAVDFVLSARDKHPNRLDILKQMAPNPTTGIFSRNLNTISSTTNTTSASPFGGGGSTTTNSGGFGSGTLSNPFGQQSGSGGTSKPSPFGGGGGSGGSGGSGFGGSAVTTSSPFSSNIASGSAFGQTSTLGTGSSAFGKPSALSSGIGTSAFGKPAFGSSGFGQAGQLGQKTSVWGSSSSAFSTGTNNQSSASPFGAAAAQSQQGNSGFGQSGFGQMGTKPSQFGASPFGQAVQSQQQSSGGGFGSIGQQPSSGFGQTTQPSTSPYGQGAQSSSSPFGVATSGGPSAFGQTAQQNAQQQNTSPFGQPVQQAASSPFGKPSPPATTSVAASSSPFATAGSNTASPFGQSNTNGFGAKSTVSSHFAPASSSDTTATGFSQSELPQKQKLQVSASGTGPYPPNSLSTHPDPSSYMQSDATGRITTFKGKPVHYRPDPFKQISEEPKPVPGYVVGGGGNFGTQNLEGTWTMIWNAKGPPEKYNPDTEFPDVTFYTDEVKRQFQDAIRTGSFAVSGMPLIPPKREWCTWDF